MKEKASLIIMSTFALVGGLFLIYWGNVFLKEPAKEEEKYKKEKTHFIVHIGKVDTIYTKLSSPKKNSIGFILNFYPHIEGVDTLFHFTHTELSRELDKHKGEKIRIEGKWDNSENAIEIFEVFANDKHIFPFDAAEGQTKSNPLFGLCILFFILGGILSLLALGIFRRMYKNYISSKKLIDNVHGLFLKAEAITPADILKLEEEQGKVKKSFHKNIAFGIAMLFFIFLVPVKYGGIHNFLHYYGKAEGDNTTYETVGLLPVASFFLVAGALFFYILRIDLRNIQKDLTEKKKIRLTGKLISKHENKKDKNSTLLTIETEGIYFEEIEIKNSEHPKYLMTDDLEIELVLYSQFILSIKRSEQDNKGFKFSKLIPD